jgi:hypothetical protein
MLLNWTFWNFGVSLADFLSAPRWTDIQLLPNHQLSHLRPLIATIEGKVNLFRTYLPFFNYFFAS